MIRRTRGTNAGGTALKILIIEDEQLLADSIAEVLRRKGFEAEAVYDGETGAEYAELGVYDLLILDVMMPGLDGIRTTAKLRESCNVPIILLTAKSEDADKILGLNIGADDYVTKPFVPMELLARVHSHLRRYEKFLRATGAAAAPALRTYVIGGLELCEDTAALTVDGTPVKLTPLEFKILALLRKNPGRVFSAEEIYERVWNERAVSTDTIMVHIRNIREKIEYNPREPKYLKVVWGIGYKIEK